MLNKRFEEKVKFVVGEDQYHDLRKTPGYTEAVNFFDRTVKMSFRDSPDERWYANFPGAELEDDPDNDIKNDTWLLKRYGIYPSFVVEYLTKIQLVRRSKKFSTLLSITSRK
jgi:hypothetical protein